MILRLLLVLTVTWAGSAWADLAQITYKGLTFGAPIPQSIVAQSTASHADEDGADELPATLRNLCSHEILATGSGQISVMTQECEGPVVFIDVHETALSFFDPATQSEPLVPEIAGMIFEETTLAKVRNLFCSEGLVDSKVYGQTDAAFGGFLLAYEVEDAEIHAVFTFVLPRETRFQTFAPSEVAELGHRDTAVLIGVTLMASDIFTLMTDDVPLSGAGYMPLPETLTNPSFRGLNCPVA